MISRLVITFLPRSKHLLISWLQSQSAVILDPPKIVCHCSHSIKWLFKIYLFLSWMVASLMASLIKKKPAMQETWFDFWAGKIPWRRERPLTSVFWLWEFHGLHSPWGHKESGTTERLSLSSWMDVEFYQMFFLPLLRWSGGFCLFFCWCSI